MKFYYSFSYFFSAVLVFFCINVNAQTSASLSFPAKLLKGDSEINVISKSDGSFYCGTSGSEISANLDKIVWPQTHDDQTISATIYRVHNGHLTLFQDNINPTAQTKDTDVFTPEAGENQSVKYRIVFTIEENGQKTTYPNDGTNIESEEVKFSIYDSEGYDVNISTQPTGSDKNTFAGRNQKVEYGATIKENDKTLPKSRIDWTINDNSDVVGSGPFYYFDVSPLQNTEKDEYTFHASVLFLNPLDDNEVWFDGGSKSSETLVVYPMKPTIDPNDVLQYPTNVKENTTHNGIECNYSVNITEDKYKNYGKLKYEWNSDIKNAQGKDNLYSFTASEDKKGDHTIHVRVACVNPDDPNDEWYDFIKEDFKQLTICLNPESIREEIINEYVKFPIEEGYNRVNTHVGKETQTYKVEIPNETEYGVWSYVWKKTYNTNSAETINVADASFNPSTTGQYSWTLSITCNNPNADENWLTIDEKEFSIPDLVVYENPNSLEFNDSNFTYPKGEDLAEHKGNDCSRSYSFTMPENAKNYGKWIYKWTRNGSEVSSGTDADIPNSVSVGSYITSLNLICVNPDNQDDIWRTFEKKFPEYVVYSKPSCTRNNLHTDPTDSDEKTYAMYVNQSLDTKDLIKTDGGNESGWRVSLLVDDVKSSNTIFAPEDVKNYTIKLSVINEASLPDGAKKILYAENIFDYIFVVYENPYDGIIAKVDNKTYTFDSDKVIDVEDKQTVEFYHDNLKFNWKLTNEKGTLDEKYDTSYKQELNNDTESEDDATKYSLSCEIDKSNLPVHFVGTLTSVIFNIYVWKIFDLKIEDLVLAPENDPNGYGGFYVIETCSDRIGVSLKGVGGTINKWDEAVVWESLDAPSQEIPSATDLNRRKDYNYRIKTKNNSDDPIEYRYEVSVKFKDKPEPFKKRILIKSWKQPELKLAKARLKNNKANPDASSIEYFINDPRPSYNPCYLGDTIMIQCDLSGGDPNDSIAWEYEYTQDNVVHNGALVDKSIPYSFKNTGSNQDSKIITVNYKYKGNYTTDSDIWYTYGNIRLYSAVYPRPELESALNDSVENRVVWGQNVVDVYAGEQDANKVNLKYYPTKGINNGWSYYWTVDGNTESGKEPEWAYNPTTNSNAPYEDKKITVRVVNELSNQNKGLDTTYVYPIRVWRKAKFDDFVLKDVIQNRELTSGSYAIREGNGIYASVPAIQYGYSSGDGSNYSYQWTGAHAENDILQWNDKAMNDKDDRTKAYDNLTYNLRMVNTGPYGNVWDVKTFSHEVTIYNKPATPTSIVQKGNGSSRTMIAMADVSDQDLQGRNYYLVFGYTDDAGVDHDFASQQQLNPGQVRWSTPFADQQQMKNAYVYALWKYDSAEISSGKCMLSGIEENYDSSIYNGSTRAVIDYDSPNAIEDVSNVKDIRSVYNLNGTKIGSSLSDLKPGLYIVEYVDGVTNKIVVK